MGIAKRRYPFSLKGLFFMNTYGYIRVSSVDQNEDRQLIAMTAHGIPHKNIYTDKQSGKDTARPALQKLMAKVKSGDTVIVESVSRFARNTRDLLDLIDKLTAKGVEFVSQKEKIDTSTPTGKFMLTVFGAVAELERGYILQRQREGIAAAKARGVRFGRPPKERPGNFAEIVRLWECGRIRFEEALKRTELKKTTFYALLREQRGKRKSS
jgi:DNA invertase Pin-like site-specific DNA recombinase